MTAATRKKVWDVQEPDPRRVERLARELEIEPLTASLLLNRGVADIDAARRFLHPDLAHLHDPFLMRNMAQAVERIVRALDTGEHILVFGDDDVDGITSTTVLFDYLRAVGANVRFFIPRRFVHGHGFNPNAVRAAIEQAERTDLLIAADCGLSGIAEIAWVAERGIDTLIVDHHSLPRELPVALILNPRLPESAFPFKDLAAVGVAFNLVLALDRRLRAMGRLDDQSAPRLDEYLDLVALGTVADVVPLVDENRIFVSLGLDVLRRRRRCGVAALLDKVCPDVQLITERTICYRIAPRLNAAGRVGDPNDCVALLSCQRYGLAQELAARLESYNERRQATEATVLTEAIEIAQQQVDAGRRILVVAREGWHQGVLGIVASRLLERFGRPSILIAMADGRARGSARSPDGVDILACMRHVDDLFDNYGGHSAAAGLTLRSENVPLLADRIERAVDVVLADGLLPRPTIHIDGEVRLRELTPKRIRELELLGPFGAANPEPCFLVKRLRALRSRVVGRNHLRMRLRGDRSVVDVIGFSMGDRAVPRGRAVDVVLTPRIALKKRANVELQLLAFESSR